MGGVTRRTFLARAGVAAAAAAGGGAALTSLTTSAIPVAAASPKPRPRKPTRADALVAHVRNIRTGEVAVLMGGREAVIRDRALVARLLGAVR